MTPSITPISRSARRLLGLAMGLLWLALSPPAAAEPIEVRNRPAAAADEPERPRKKKPRKKKTRKATKRKKAVKKGPPKGTRLKLGAPPGAAPAAESTADAATEDDATPEDEGPVVPRVELVYAGANDDFPSLYGHTAMLAFTRPDQRVEDAEIFNFGVTHPPTREGYVLQFIGGRVEFWGDIRRYGRQLRGWKRADRTVVRIPVNLDTAAAERLIARMRRDTSDAHKMYVYDTFRENCSTRLRDYLDEYSGGAVYGALGNLPTGQSYRDDVREHYAPVWPVLLLTEIVPGIDLDKPRTMYERAYLPAMTVTALRMVSVPSGEPLLGPAIVDNLRQGADPHDGWPHIAQAIIYGFGLLVLLVALVVPRLGSRARGLIWLFWLGGSLLYTTTLLLVGLTSDWPDMQRNFALVAWPPTDLILLLPAIQLVRRRRFTGDWVRIYLMLRAASTVVLVALTPLWSAIDGPLHVRVVALAGLLLAWRALRPSLAPAEASRPQRLLGGRTGQYPTMSHARHQLGDRRASR